VLIMGSAIIPTQRVDRVEIGHTTISNPVLILKVGDIVYANGYRIEYHIGYRSIFPGLDSATGKVYIYCHNLAYGEDLPALAVNNVEVLLIG